jgi:hypothetical protein
LGLFRTLADLSLSAPFLESLKVACFLAWFVLYPCDHDETIFADWRSFPAPIKVLYLSGFYKRSDLGLRIGLFYTSASLSGAFGGMPYEKLMPAALAILV